MASMKKDLDYQSLKIFAVIYLSLPLLTFCIGYLRWQFALAGVAAMVYASVTYLKKRSVRFQNRGSVEVNVGMLVALLGAVLLWTWFGGLNGMFYQTGDWEFRNPIYHDMVLHDWPVIYPEKNSALNYYIGTWFVPAAVGKLMVALLGEFWGWRMARIVLWLWVSGALYVTILLLIVYTKANSVSKQLRVFLLFVLFSGMDIVGGYLRDKLDFLFENWHLEWWHSLYQFSSITTCVYWVFNQSVIPWLAVMCFLFERDSRNYLLIGAACLICGPLPFVGLVILMVAREAARVIKEGFIHRKWRECFRAISVQNCLLLIGIFFVLLFFYLSNNALQGSTSPNAAEGVAAAVGTADKVRKIVEYFDLRLLGFYMLEVGIYLLLLFPSQRGNVLYWTTILSLLILPYFKVGVSNDFCMRASIPGVFLTMVFCCDAIVNQCSRIEFRKAGIPTKLRLIALVLALAIGACTPAVEIARGWHYVLKEKTLFLENKTYQSLSDLSKPTLNFETSNYSETPFFRYFAK